MAASQRGASHIRSGRPNEDACAVREGEVVVVAVADGHGSDQSPRSAIGAACVVEVAVEVLSRLRSAPGGRGRREAVDAIVEGWRTRVEEHWRAHDSHDGSQESAVPWIVYGTTLLVAAGFGSGEVLLVRVGDGDIIAIAHDRTVRQPLPAAQDLAPTETHSLAQSDVGAVAQTAVLDAGQQTALIAVATDGFGGAFADPDWVEPVGSQLATEIPGRDPAQLQRQLEQWLEGPADVAGDDTTMALLIATRELT